MSDPGKIENAITCAIRRKRWIGGKVKVDVEGVVRSAYDIPDWVRPTEAQRTAISLAMRSFVSKYPGYSLSGEGTTSPRIIKADEPDPSLPR
jgi:hypothetical protein